MDYSNCKLYQLQSKKYLKYLLKISDNKYLKQNYISSQIRPYIDHNTPKPRLIEAPNVELKKIQIKIKKYLNDIIVPDYVFSGIKGRSYYDNAKFHIGNKYIYKIDIIAFFPSISREKVYKFFKNKLLVSSDIAKILTNLTTINLKDLDDADIDKFLKSKKIKTRNHLITGAPTSQILSYLVNIDMFEKIQNIAIKNNIIMTIYVDDITFSSDKKISNKTKEEIISAIKRYEYAISKKKTKFYTKKYPKLITGVIISEEGIMVVKNSLRLKIINTLKKFKQDPTDEKTKQRLRGLLSAARQIEPSVYPSIYKLVFNKKS